MKALPPSIWLICSATQAVSTSTTYPVASAAAATANPGYISMDGYAHLSIQFNLIGNAGGTPTNVTLTVEASNDPTFATYVDITASGYEEATDNSGSTSYSTTGGGTLAGCLDFDLMGMRYARVRLTTNAGTNSSGTNTIYATRHGGHVS